MSTDQPGRRLRFDAGGYEEPVFRFIVFLQFGLGAMLAFLAFGFLYLTVGSLVEPRPVTSFFGMIPYLIALTASLYFLEYLLE